MKFPRTRIGVLTAFLSVILPAAARGEALTNAPAADAPAFLQGEVLVKFNKNVTDAQIATAFQNGALSFLHQVQTPAMRAAGEIGITRAATKLPVPQAVQALAHLPGVELAQPNWIYTHQTYGINDPFFLDGSLWGMSDSTYGSHAATVWANGQTGSKNVYVGVIDEGLEYYHPDLAANVWTNPGESGVDANGVDKASNGIDDDGSPEDAVHYADDVHGWNTVGSINNGNIYDPANDDHGTHVSGTIGAVSGNGRGVSGMNWNVTIISGKFLGPNGGSTSDAIEAIDYMTYLKQSGKANIVALNNSWGGGPFDQLLFDSITRAAQQQILFVAAAGNGDTLGRAINTDASANYPSCYDTSKNGADYDSVIAVTAIDKNGNKASWANYGATTVDLGAPGVAITSTLPGGSYGSYDGTSMATPHVTGAIALYAAAHPSASAKEIRDALIQAATQTPTPSLNGITKTGGRLDVAKFLAIVPPSETQAPVVTAPDAPSAPADPSLAAVAASSSEILLSWTDNSSNESGFKIQRSTDGTTWTDLVIAGANDTTYADKSLAALTTYSYRVVAYNAGGSSSEFTASATTLAPPPPPTATFLAKDTTTKGAWISKYGTDGSVVIADSTNWPAYVSLSTDESKSDWVWAASTTDSRGLQKSASPSDRIAACWYSAGKFNIDLNLTDGAAHRVSFYCVDWETTARAQTIEIVDPATGAVVSSQSVASFNGGQYLTWNLQGHAIVRFTCTGGKNAVVSGIFFDAPAVLPAAPGGLAATPLSKSQIALSWTDNSNNESGFSIERSTDGKTFTQIATVAANTVKYTSTSLRGGTKYYYRVRAYNSAGYSAYTAVASATTPQH